MTPMIKTQAGALYFRFYTVRGHSRSVRFFHRDPQRGQATLHLPLSSGGAGESAKFLLLFLSVLRVFAVNN